MPAISIDPETGLKIFDTRAAMANENIAGNGYAVNHDQAAKTLPEQKPGAVSGTSN